MRLVWSFVAALAAFTVAGTRTAHAGACTSQTCTCDDECSGLLCSADGHCCGPPVATGRPCKKDGGAAGTSGGSAGTGGGSAGTGGSDAGTPPASSGGCRVGGVGDEAAPGVALAAAALALAAARRRSTRRT